MKVGIEFIKSAGIRNEMRRDSYTTAEFLGTFNHPTKDGSDWEICLYRACDTLVIETNGDPVWQGQDGFEELLAEYNVDVNQLASAAQ